MDKLKTVGLLFLGLLFFLLEVAFFAASITVVGLLLWLVGLAFGLFETGTFQVNWWISASIIVILLEGCKSQIKESYKVFNEFKSIWSK